MSKSWHIVNAEEENKANPDTFKIPNIEERQSLKPDTIVKLIFRTDDESEGERMWVEITKSNNFGYDGVLDNDPVNIKGLKSGDKVTFGPQHIIDIYID